MPKLLVEFSPYSGQKCHEVRVEPLPSSPPKLSFFTYMLFPMCLNSGSGGLVELIPISISLMLVAPASAGFFVTIASQTFPFADVWPGVEEP